MQAIRGWGRERLLTAVSAVPFAIGTTMDSLAWVSGRDVPPSSTAAATWLLLAVGIAAGCCILLLRVLQRNRWEPHRVRTLRRGVVLELMGIGLMLGSLMLRGHREIPPDPPLLSAQVVGLALLLAAGWVRVSSARAAVHADANTSAA